jgi:hypothetical protein
MTRIMTPGLAAMVLSLAPIHHAMASYGIYAGKNLTADGSVLLDGRLSVRFWSRRLVLPQAG